MGESRINEAIARPTRTLVQAAPSYAIVEFVDAFIYDMSDKQYAAAVVFLTIVLGALQTVIENAKGWAFLRNIPPTTAPVVESTPDAAPPVADGGI